MTKAAPSRPGDGPAALIAVAAEWHQRLVSGDAPDHVRAEFDAWRTASPAHALAYAEVEAAWRLTRECADAAPILTLRHHTLTRLIVPRRRGPSRAAAAAAILAAAALLAPLGRVAVGPERIAAERAQPLRAPSPGLAGRVYQTGVGERLTIALADGSTAVLNTASRLRVVYSDQERRLVLESGEALFQVAKGQRRPFVVSAGGRNITAHGTQFDVRLSPDRVKVALLEGVVSIRGGSAAAEVRLKPDEVLVADDETTSVRTVSDIAELVSWRDGLLFFDNSTLAQAAAEMNRYLDHPKIEVAPDVADVRLSGSFRTGETAAFVNALEQGFPIAVVARTPDRIVLGASPPRRPPEA